MKRIRKFIAASVIAGMMGTGVPLMAAQQHNDNRAAVQHQAANRQWNGNQNRNSRANGRQENNRRDNQRDRGRGNDNGYAPVRVYQPAPVYREPAYSYGYYEQPSHDGRTAAIIGGSAAAGALIGAATDHGQGAVIGAIIGGVAGAAISAEANHHDRY